MARLPTTPELEEWKADLPSRSASVWWWCLAPFAVVVVLVALGWAWSSFRRHRVASVSSKITRVSADLSAIGLALDSYAAEHGGAYPPTLGVLTTPSSSGQAYLKSSSALVDPWMRLYTYERDPKGRGYAIGSLGRDGAPGGVGEDADYSIKLR